MISRFINFIEEMLLAALLAAMVVLSFVQVVLRYGFNIGITWALEAITYMFAWMVLLGMSYCVKTGSHLGVDVFVKSLPARGYWTASVLGGLLCMLYASILLVGAWTYVDRMYLVGVEAESFAVPKWLILTALPIGFALLIFRFGQATWRVYIGRQAGLGLTDEVNESLELVHADAPPKQEDKSPK